MALETMSVHFKMVTLPRPAYLIGNRDLIAQAEKLPNLQRGPAGRFNVPGLGMLRIFDIKVGNDHIYEVEEAVALQMIEHFGLNLGEEGVALQAIDGS